MMSGSYVLHPIHSSPGLAGSGFARCLASQRERSPFFYFDHYVLSRNKVHCSRVVMGEPPPPEIYSAGTNVST
jgi:hypothetical protein